MSWNDLSMKDKASYIRMGVENGITDLDAIREVYNKFAEGGNLNVNDSPEKRTYDHNKGVYYVEGQNAPNNLKYSLDEFTQEQINEINSKYNKGWKTDKKGNVIFNKYTGTPLNTNLKKSFANKEAYEHYTQEEPTPVGTKYKSNPSIVKAENMFKTVVRTMQRDSVDNSEDVVKRRNEEARKRYERTQQQNKEYNEEYKHRAGQFLDALALTSALGAMGTQIGASNVANKAMRVGMSTPKYNKLMSMSKNLDTANTIFEGIGIPLDIYQASEGFVNNDMKQALTNTYSALTPISKLIKVSNPKYYWLKPAASFTGNLMEPLSKIFKEGGPIKKSYKDFSTRLSKAWHNQDLSKDDYDYQKYYNDDPDRAYRQLISIEKGGHGHFDDEGRSGIYKTPNHATYPDLGPNSWLNDDKIFNMSARQAVPENTDRVLDYLGSDLDYNRGATKVMYDGAYQLPEVTVTPNGNYTELVPNELNTGWMYRDRAGRFDDVDYSYLDNYLGNKKALGGNLYGNGGSKPRYRSSSNIRKQISTWEGSTMRTNVPFDRMDTMFNQVLPEGALEKLSQEQLDGLYSFAYNVGTGRFKTRTAPTLAKYLQGNATIEDVKNTIWASGDKKYRGLANRRKKERSMLGDYVPVQETISMTTPLDITPAAQPIIESNPVIQDNIETFPLAFNIESQKESDYTPGFLNYVNYINQIRQPKQRDRRIWLTI